MDTLGWIILSTIERLSSFGGNNALPLYRESVLYTEVSFIQSVLIRGSTVRVCFMHLSTLLQVFRKLHMGSVSYSQDSMADVMNDYTLYTAMYSHTNVAVCCHILQI